MEKMKKIYVSLLILVTVISALILSSCQCNHEYSGWTKTKAPTCESYGVSERVCNKCGEKEQKMVQPSSDHSFGEWETVSAPTCIGIGEKKRTCTVCEKTESRGLPFDINAHAFGEWSITKEPTNDENGERERTCTLCQKSEKEILLAIENQ